MNQFHIGIVRFWNAISPFKVIFPTRLTPYCGIDLSGHIILSFTSFCVFFACILWTPGVATLNAFIYICGGPLLQVFKINLLPMVCDYILLASSSHNLIVHGDSFRFPS